MTLVGKDFLWGVQAGGGLEDPGYIDKTCVGECPILTRLRWSWSRQACRSHKRIRRMRVRAVHWSIHKLLGIVNLSTDLAHEEAGNTSRTVPRWSHGYRKWERLRGVGCPRGISFAPLSTILFPPPGNLARLDGRGFSWASPERVQTWLAAPAPASPPTHLRLPPRVSCEFYDILHFMSLTRRDLQSPDNLSNPFWSVGPGSRWGQG